VIEEALDSKGIEDLVDGMPYFPGVVLGISDSFVNPLRLLLFHAVAQPRSALRCYPAVRSGST
jgi:hypothetical protein